MFAYRNEDGVALSHFRKVIHILWPGWLFWENYWNATCKHRIKEWPSCGTVSWWLQAEFRLVHCFQKRYRVVARHADCFPRQLCGCWWPTGYLQNGDTFVKTQIVQVWEYQTKCWLLISHVRWQLSISLSVISAKKLALSSNSLFVNPAVHAWM